MKITLVVGARPNFMKIAPIIREIKKHSIDYRLIHTGQHYDRNMSDVFFEDLDIPKPHLNLAVGSGSHAEQTAELICSFEQYCKNAAPDHVLVVGDINSTLACALVVSKIKSIKLSHVEAGLRSFDREMPEEINRIVTDVLSDHLFCTAQIGVDNLIREGINKDKIHLVGDVMIDNLIHNVKHSGTKSPIEGEYVLMTVHRPSNTDDGDNLESILLSANEIAKEMKVVFPIHPRTIKQIDLFKLNSLLDKLDCCEPLNYLGFLNLMKYAKIILTDSGGVQPEAYYLKIPCITMRTTTEHLFTLSKGTNVIVGPNKEKILEEYRKLRDGLRGNFIENKLYDGKAAERIVKIVLKGNK